MPEGYTHVRTALNTLNQDEKTRIDLDIYGLGANGPDFFFGYKVYDRKENRKIKAIGAKIHKEKPGKFLLTLVKNSNTNITRAYTMGFLSHYATDHTLHPFVKYITSNGPYNMKRGHALFEIELDSELYAVDYGTRYIPADVSTPEVDEYALDEICEMIKKTIYETYNIDISIDVLKSSFKGFYMVRGLFMSKYGVKRAFFRAVETAAGKENYIIGHVVPAKPLKPLPRKWQNPYTEEESSKTVPDLLEEAKNKGREYTDAAKKYWNGEALEEELIKIIGSKSYSTGLEV